MSGTLTTTPDDGGEGASASVRCYLAPSDMLTITDEGEAGFEISLTSPTSRAKIIQLTREDMQQLMCWVLARLHKTGE